MAAVTGEVGVRLVVLQARLAHEARKARLNSISRNAGNERVSNAVVLSVGEDVGFASLNDGGVHHARRRSGAQRVGVEARVGSDAARDFATTVAERDRSAILSVTRQAPRGGLHRGCANGDLGHVAVLEAELARRGRSHEQRVVPGDLGGGVREFLQPSEIGEAAVADLGVEEERDFHRIVRADARRSAAAKTRNIACVDHRNGRSLRRGAFDKSLVEIRPPSRLEGQAREAGALDVRATNDFVARNLIVGGDGREHFERITTALLDVHDWKNERLLHNDGTVDGATVGPALKAVRGGDMPGASRGLAGFVGVEREVRNFLRLGHLGGEIDVGGRVVDGIATEDDERLDAARGECCADFLQLRHRARGGAGGV